MKRVGNLFDSFCSIENLFNAAHTAFKGTKRKNKNAEYLFNLEKNLFNLQEKLIQDKYSPGKYRYFKIYEPKERLISVAEIEDRIIHHALINVLSPTYEKVFIYDSYATRKMKGSHKAISKAQKLSIKYKWFLKTDIEKYFDSINHDVLIKLISKKIKDKKVVKIVQKIIFNSDFSKNINTGKGLPIGNLTSQFFANVYLNEFDHYVKETLMLPYVRYMDDMLFFSNNKSELKKLFVIINTYLTQEMLLKIKAKSIIFNRVSLGIPFLGFRIFPKLIRVKRENIIRMKKKIISKEKQYKLGYITDDQLFRSVNSTIEFIKHADSLNLRKKIFGL